MPVGNGARLCAACAKRESAEKARKRDYAKEYRKRADDPRYKSFYRSKQWQMTSKKYAQSVRYRCEDCGEVGTDVHHIVPIQTDEGWEHRFDFKNLRLLCVACHNEAHGRTFSNNWGESDGRYAEEAAGPADGPQADEGAEGGEAGDRGVPRVSDYRV